MCILLEIMGKMLETVFDLKCDVACLSHKKRFKYKKMQRESKTRVEDEETKINLEKRVKDEETRIVS